MIPKQEYSWQTYKWCQGDCYSMTKYNDSEIFGIVDNKKTLDYEDDAAYVNLGEMWRMPTKDESAELLQYCDMQPALINGVEGTIITSRINGNSIFCPTRWPWTSSCHGGCYAYSLGGYSQNRCEGLPIRPVLNGITMHPSFSEIQGVGGQIEFYIETESDISIVPDSDWIHLLDISSDMNHKVSLSIDRNSTGTLREGKVQVFLDNGLLAKSFFVIQAKSYSYEAEAIDLGLSVRWSLTNLGASCPSESGAYFAWGEVEPKVKLSKEDFTTYKWASDDLKLLKYNNLDTRGIVDNKDVLDPEDDAAHVKMGRKWRMPTVDECVELIEGCSWEKEQQDGVFGIRFISTKNGNSIFLPFAGSFSQPFAGGMYYWSSNVFVDYTFFSYSIGINAEIGRAHV